MQLQTAIVFSCNQIKIVANLLNFCPTLWQRNSNQGHIYISCLSTVNFYPTPRKKLCRRQNKTNFRASKTFPRFCNYQQGSSGSSSRNFVCWRIISHSCFVYFTTEPSAPERLQYVGHSTLSEAQHPPLEDRRPQEAITRSNTTISAAWYTGWHATDFPLSQVSWSKYTHLAYAFALTTPDVTTLSLDSSDLQLIPQFVSAAHQNGVKAALSIGGWTGSRWFSPHVNNAANRTSFVKTVTSLAQKFDLDGIDFDWEFPGNRGIGCNEFDPNDTNNFLAFLQELRNSTVGKSLVLSAATLDTPWVDTTGAPSSNISAFSEVLDYISIMNYDVMSSPTVGAGSSSPLNDSCAPAGARFGSAASAVDAWTAAGMPASKIVLGVPAYGHSFVLPPDARQNYTIGPYPPYNTSLERPGDKWDGDGGVDVCGVMEGPGGTFSYWGLMDEGFINPDGSAVKGVQSFFSDCSQTPFLYNDTTGVYVSYDNAASFAIKGGFIVSAGLRGFAMWEAGGDFNDTLLDAILNATQNGGPTTNSATQSSAGPSHVAAASSGIQLSRAMRYILLSVAFLSQWL